MGKIKELKIDRFDGGIAFDNRKGRANEFSRSLNFDIFKKPSTLSPIRGIESDQDFGGANGFKAYDAGAFGQSAAGGIVYAWARKTTSNTGVKLFSKAPTDSVWTTVTDVDSAQVEATTGSPVPGSNIVTTFDSSGEQILWGIVNSADSLSSGFRMLTLVSFKVGVATSFAKKTLTSASAVNITGIEPFIILGIDGNGYCFDANKVHRLNTDGTVTSDIFTVSSQWRITSACTYGSYMAMAIRGFGMSRVILWDYVDTQASENIDFGEGVIIALANINGVLVAVIDKFINTLMNGSGSSNGQGSMQIKIWAGGTNVGTVTEVKAHGVLSGSSKNYHFRRNNCIYWYAKIPLDASATTSLEGIWSFGKLTDGQPWALSLHREVPTAFEVFHMQGDYTYFAHGNDGSVSRTHDDETYTLTSTYDSLIFNDDDASIEKALHGASVTFEALTSGQSVTLKYRKDGATAWTTAKTESTIGKLSLTAPLRGNFREIQFRIESTGGAKPNGLKMKYEELTNSIQ